VLISEKHPLKYEIEGRWCDVTQFVRDRITQLRIAKGVSEYQMSYDLGHSRSYINNISSGKSMPSLVEFFAICDYFEITPQAFFDSGHKSPALAEKAIDEIRRMDDEDVLMILTLINRMNREK
jgi:transcriptional regulator with XRE-family HTH domain